MLFADSILRTLHVGEVNRYVKDRKVHFKSFPTSKAKQLNHHTIAILEEHQCDAAAIHVETNDLLKKNVHCICICNDILEIALRCRNDNIGKEFISIVAYSTKVSSVLIQQFNVLLHKTCGEYRYRFVFNEAVSSLQILR